MSEEAVQAAEAPEEKEKSEPKPDTTDDARVDNVAGGSAPEPPSNPEETSYQAVEKEGTVTAIWEMQGQKHVRTIDPRSAEGKQILALFETAA